MSDICPYLESLTAERDKAREEFRRSQKINVSMMKQNAMLRQKIAELEKEVHKRDEARGV